jgi:hypothetical protein
LASTLIVVSCVIGQASVLSALVVSPNLNISGGTDLRPAKSAAVAVNGNNIVGAWFRRDGVANLRTAISRDGGITWADSIIQPRPSERFLGRASVSIDNNETALLAVMGDDGSQGHTIFIFDGVFGDQSWQWRRRPNAVPYMSFDDADESDGIQVLCDRANSGVIYLVFTRRPQRYEGRIQFVRSTDSGETWSFPVEMSGIQCNTAQLALGPEGELFVVWEDYEQGAIVGRRSNDQGRSFGAPFTLGEIHDNVSFGPPGWEDPSRSPLLPNVDCMDFPAFLGVAVDTSHGPHRGTIYGVWSERGLGTAKPDPVRTVFETEPNDGPADATPVEIGDDFAGAFSGDPEHDNDFDLFTFEGTAGATIQITGTPLNIKLLCGDDPAELTQVGCGSMYDQSIPPAIYTLPTTGRYYLYVSAFPSYRYQLREYVVDPASVARDHRDVVLVRSTDGGTTWSEKVRVNDDAPMYDNAIPAVTVDGSGRVHAAWYDRRDAPECGARVHTYWTWSEDGGATFQPSRRVSEQPSEGGRRYDGPGQENTWQVGDHLGLQAEREKVYLLWTFIPIGGGGEIYGSVIDMSPTGPPAIAEVVPGAGAPREQVTIHGVNLSGVTGVYFHNVLASFTIASDTEIMAEVPAGGRTGYVSAANPYHRTSSPQLFYVAPRINAVLPSRGLAGQAVRLLGVNFTGATAVRFNGLSASFTVVSDTLIKTTVPEGATEGPIEVAGPGGDASSDPFLIGALMSGLNLAWNDCGNEGNPLQQFACDVNEGEPFALVGSFTPPVGVDRLIGITAELWIVNPTGRVPAWWELRFCGRDIGDFYPRDLPPGLSGCRVVPLQVVGYELQYPTLSEFKLVMRFEVPVGAVAPLDAAVEHYAFRMELGKSASAGFKRCAGCATPVQLELRSLQLHQPAEIGFDPVITNPLISQVAYWQRQPTTPVLISGLTVEAQADGAEVRWWVGDVGEVREFRVHRAVGNGEFGVVGTMAPQGDGEYRWRDATVEPGTRYRYRLEAVRHEGVSLWDGPVELVVIPAVVRLAWSGVAPNPFADAVELELVTPDQSATRVSVYDVTGHRVAALVAELQNSRLLVRWNGRDRDGRSVAPGVYLIRAQFGAQTVVRQVVRMR